MAEFYCRVVPPTDAHTVLLEPAEALSEEIMGKLPLDRNVRVEASLPRNMRHHNFYFALLGKISKNLPEGVNLDVEALHQTVKMGAGLTYPVKIPNTDILYEFPRSIAIHKMDDLAFREFMERAIPFITTKLCPGWDDETLLNEVFDMLAGGR